MLPHSFVASYWEHDQPFDLTATPARGIADSKQALHSYPPTFHWLTFTHIVRLFWPKSLAPKVPTLWRLGFMSDYWIGPSRARLEPRVTQDDTHFLPTGVWHWRIEILKCLMSSVITLPQPCHVGSRIPPGSYSAFRQPWFCRPFLGTAQDSS